MDFAEKQFTNYRLNGLRGVSTLLRLQYFVALQLAISIDLSIVGYNNVISTGCTAGTVAIGMHIHLYNKNCRYYFCRLEQRLQFF